jgi:hypothetical protein
LQTINIRPDLGQYASKEQEVLMFTKISKLVSLSVMAFLVTSTGDVRASNCMITDWACKLETTAFTPQKSTISFFGDAYSEPVLAGVKYSARKQRYMPILKKVKPDGLPLRLAAAVVTVESSWRPRARGAAGERGLMQLMPATAKMLGVRGNLYDPATNMRAGTRYLYSCYKKAGGNIAATIGCYNRGPGKMWQWSKNHLTRRYVKKVKQMVKS